jgi:peptidoglycan/LPS O-acetylase OafA/YrhL
MKHAPQLDAFRGLCVTAVFLCHAEFLQCGWVGVQAFFVLSGFLITGVLLEAKQRSLRAGEFFRNFYARRSLRILPVYLTYLAVVFLLAGSPSPGSATVVRNDPAENALYLFTFTYNFFRILTGPANAAFGHLWTLSIEEQFYLAWPLCAFLLSRRRLLLTCKILVFGGPLIRLAEYLYLQAFSPDLAGDSGRVIYFLTMSHLDAFAIGALLNFRNEDGLVGRIADLPARKILLPVVLVSAAMLLLAKRAHLGLGGSTLGWPLYLQNFQAQVWGYSVLNLVFFMAIAKADNPGPLLRNRLLQRLGKVSYGFYIFHLPVLWICFTLSHSGRGSFTAYNLAVTALAFVASWSISELSFRLLEAPLMRLKKHFALAPAQVVLPAAGPG